MTGCAAQAEEILYGRTVPRHQDHLLYSPSGYWIADDDQLNLPVTSDLLDWLRAPGQDQEAAAGQLEILRSETDGPLVLSAQLDVIDDGVEATMADGSRQLLITANSTIWLMHEQFGPEGSIPTLCRHLPGLRDQAPEDIFAVHGVVGYGSDPNAD